MIFYNIILFKLICLLKFIALFSSKIAVFLKERSIKTVLDSLPKIHDKAKTGAIYVESSSDSDEAGNKKIWVHVSSAGEYEYVRPLIELYKSRNYKIFITYFSSSFIRTIKDFSLFNWHGFLPLDTKSDMEKLISEISPNFVVLVKYDIWPNMVNILSQKNIPIFLISAHFHGVGAKHRIKFIEKFFVRLFNKFSKIFVISEKDFEKFSNSGVLQEKLIINGDTRVDRVFARKQAFKDSKNAFASEVSEKFLQFKKQNPNKKIFIFGSVWPTDFNAFISKFVIENKNKFHTDWTLLFVPHKMDSIFFEQVKTFAQNQNLVFSLFSEGILENANIIMFDKIGCLAEMYSFADLAYVGGGFQNAGIHSVLEPSAYDVSFCVGPNHTKSPEAKYLISEKLAFVVNTVSDFEKFIFYYKPIPGVLEKKISLQIGASQRIFEVTKCL